MAVGFKDPKVNLFIEDGIKFMERSKNIYDVIITDSSDPVGALLLSIAHDIKCTVFQIPCVSRSCRLSVPTKILRIDEKCSAAVGSDLLASRLFLVQSRYIDSQLQ